MIGYKTCLLVVLLNFLSLIHNIFHLIKLSSQNKQIICSTTSTDAKILTIDQRFTTDGPWKIFNDS